MIWTLLGILGFDPNPVTEVYASPGGTNLRLDLYRPAGEGPFPCVILIHGGGWGSGDKSQMAPHAKVLVEQGIAAASVQYRFAPKNLWPAQLVDVRAAADYLRKNAASLRLSPRRFAAAGESAGAHLSHWLGVEGDVRAVGAMSPLLDCTLPMSPEGERYQIVQRTLGPGWRSKVRAFSPLFKAKKGGPPVYFIHGQRDPWVPVEHSTKPAAYLQRLHTETRVVIVPTMGHGLAFKDPKQAAAWRAFARWVGTVP